MTQPTTPDACWLFDLTVKQYRSWRFGTPLFVEELIREVPHPIPEHNLIDLIYAEILLRFKNGSPFRLSEYSTRFPSHGALIKRLVALDRLVHIESHFREPSTLSSLFDGEDRAKDALESAGDNLRTRMPRIEGYTLHKVVGAGGMGVVYDATRVIDNKRVAVKMLLSRRDSTLQSLARFRTEAIAYSCLHHNNIVKIHDLGHSEGIPYIVTEFAENGSLDDYLAKRRDVSIPFRVRTIRHVADALVHAHNRQILHRDIKPSNILITADGFPLLADFGLVKFVAPVRHIFEEHCTVSHQLFDDPWQIYRSVSGPPQELPIDISEMSILYSRVSAVRQQAKAEIFYTRKTVVDIVAECVTRYDIPSSSFDINEIEEFVNGSLDFGPRPDFCRFPENRTFTGAILGSPQFMSPEQARGNVAGPRSDIYGLGATLYYALTEVPPFQGATTHRILCKVQEEVPRAPHHLNSEISSGLSHIVMTALEKNELDRYPTVKAFMNELDAFLDRSGSSPQTGESTKPLDYGGGRVTCSLFRAVQRIFSWHH